MVTILTIIKKVDVVTMRNLEPMTRIELVTY